MPTALSSINDELRHHLTWLLRLLSRGSFSPGTVPLVRRLINTLGATRPLPEPRCEVESVPGTDGSPGVPVHVVQRPDGAARTDARVPAVLFIHGGGYISGTAAMALPTAQRMASRLGCVVVVPDYRVAPETRFPDSLEDNYRTLAWMHQNAERLGIDTSRIALYGESAGGGHAAALAIAVRDRGEFTLAAQVLIYPMLDDRTGSTRQVAWPMGHYVWTAKMNRVGWTCHLGVPAGSAQVPKGAVPARVADLRGLPPTFIGVGTVDLFHDEDVAYAMRLRAAGVPVELNVVPGAFHGFDNLAPDTDCSKRFIRSWSDMLSRTFTTEPLPAATSTPR
jgi:acetyl esterase/lipase